MRYVVFLTLLSNLCLIIPFSERLLAENRFFRYCVCFWQTAVFFVYLLVYLIDILVYFYLNQRVDLTLLDLLEEADIGFAMIWQSYPVFWISLAFFILSIAYFGFWNRVFATHAAVPVHRKKHIVFIGKRAGTSLGFAVFCVAAFCFFCLFWGMGKSVPIYFPCAGATHISVWTRILL